jgi:hypothetical protein
MLIKSYRGEQTIRYFYVMKQLVVILIISTLLYLDGSIRMGKLREE